MVGSRFSNLLKGSYNSNAQVSVIVDEGECMLNQLITDVAISRCIHKTFGTKVKGNLAKALDKSQNVLSKPENGDINMESGSSIFGKIRAEPAPYNTFDLFEFTKVNEPCLNIKLNTGEAF